jgi:hypothetical protein
MLSFLAWVVFWLVAGPLAVAAGFRVEERIVEPLLDRLFRR